MSAKGHLKAVAAGVHKGNSQPADEDEQHQSSNLTNLYSFGNLIHNINSDK
jgi:hypothetical protein